MQRVGRLVQRLMARDRDEVGELAQREVGRADLRAALACRSIALYRGHCASGTVGKIHSSPSCHGDRA